MTKEEVGNYLRITDFDDVIKSREEARSTSQIVKFSVNHSKEGEYLIFIREDGTYRIFNTLGDILYLLNRSDLFTLYSIVRELYADQVATGLGLMLLGDLIIMMETEEDSSDQMWRNQDEWEIMLWRFNQSYGVHVLELENGITIHMLADQMYPLTVGLMERLLDHGLQVQEESDGVADFVRWFLVKLDKNKDTNNM